MGAAARMPVLTAVVEDGVGGVEDAAAEDDLDGLVSRCRGASTAARTKATTSSANVSAASRAGCVAVGRRIEEDAGELEQTVVRDRSRVDAGEHRLGVGLAEMGRDKIATGRWRHPGRRAARRARPSARRPSQAPPGAKSPESSASAGKRTVRPSGPTAAQFMPVPQTTPTPQVAVVPARATAKVSLRSTTASVQPLARSRGRASLRRPGGRCRPGSRRRSDRAGTRRRRVLHRHGRRRHSPHRHRQRDGLVDAVMVPSSPTSWWLLGPTRARPRTAPALVTRTTSVFVLPPSNASTAGSDVERRRARSDVTLPSVGTKVAVVGGGSTYTPELVDGLCDLEDRMRRRRSRPARSRASAARSGGRAVGADPAPARGGAARSPRRRTRTPRSRERTSSWCNCASAARRRATSTRRCPSGTAASGRRPSAPAGWPRRCARCRSCSSWPRRWRPAANPGAWLVDFTNPVGIVTQALLDEGHRAVGLCNVAIWAQRRLGHYLGVDPDDVAVEHVGSTT